MIVRNCFDCQELSQLSVIVLIVIIVIIVIIISNCFNLVIGELCRSNCFDPSAKGAKTINWPSFQFPILGFPLDQSSLLSFVSPTSTSGHFHCFTFSFFSFTFRSVFSVFLCFTDVNIKTLSLFHIFSFFSCFSFYFSISLLFSLLFHRRQRQGTPFSKGFA